MALFAYMKQTQRLIGDVRQMRVAPNDIIDYVNIARRHVAEITQCVRVLTPISGSLTSITITTGGSGYTSTPTITITAPDSPGGLSTDPSGVQVTASVTVTGGTITSVTVTDYGAGYFQPTVEIEDSTGTGATLTAITSTITSTVQGQEVYNFSDMPLNDASVSSLIAVQSVSMIYNGLRYTLGYYAFSDYQAYIRRYPFQYYYVPGVCAQHGQGANGSLYMYPIASATYQYQVDGYGLPIDLVTDSTSDAIPYPWKDSIPYYAAYLALLELQRANDARGMLDLFYSMVSRQGVAARPSRTVNPYGRY